MYKLLLVDDEPQILNGLKLILDWARLGFYRIETAGNFEDAVDLAIEVEPDVALFDVRLGERYGFEIITRLNEMNLKTIYIMISGYSEFEYARQAMRCGARAYMLKPINRAELQTLVEQIILSDFGGTLQDIDDKREHIDPVSRIPYSKLSKLTNKMLVIIKSDYSGNLSLKIIAEKFKMNSAYLGQSFLKETKLKFSEYLMAYRLQKAHELIQGSNDKIQYIAKQVGYTNLNYFYVQFRLFYGISPSDIRKN